MVVNVFLASNSKMKRLELDKCLYYLRGGNILVLNKLDCFGRTTEELIELS